MPRSTVAVPTVPLSKPSFGVMRHCHLSPVVVAELKMVSPLNLVVDVVPVYAEPFLYQLKLYVIGSESASVDDRERLHTRLLVTVGEAGEMAATGAVGIEFTTADALTGLVETEPSDTEIEQLIFAPRCALVGV